MSGLVQMCVCQLGSSTSNKPVLREDQVCKLLLSENTLPLLVDAIHKKEIQSDGTINLVGTTVHGDDEEVPLLLPTSSTFSVAFAMAQSIASSFVVTTRHHSTTSRKTPVILAIR